MNPLAYVIQIVRDIIEDELPQWCWLLEPGVVISSDSVQYYIVYKQYGVRVGYQKKTLTISISKPLLDTLGTLADVTDDHAWQSTLSALRRQICWYFQRISTEPRPIDWVLTEDVLDRCEEYRPSPYTYMS